MRPHRRKLQRCVAPTDSKQEAADTRTNGIYVSRRDAVFLFSYFTCDGEDGLHLAYSEDGLLWHALNGGASILKPEIGSDRLMRDPHLSQSPDGTFHLVWTTSWNDRIIGYANSTDLTHWSEQRALGVMTHEPEARNCWAPEIFFDDPTGRYFILWSTTIPGRFPETDASGDKGLNHRLYYTTTHDFLSLSQARLFYDPGFNVIDATVVRDNDRYVMFLKNETRQPLEKNIRVACSRNITGPYSTPSPPITGNYWAEGPTVIKIDETWHVYFDKYIEKEYGLVTSSDLVSWQDRSDDLRMPEGACHGSILCVDANVLNPWLQVSDVSGTVQPTS